MGGRPLRDRSGGSADRAPPLPSPPPDGRVSPVVLPGARHQRATGHPYRPPPYGGSRCDRPAQRQRRGAPGQRRIGRRRPRDRHLRSYRKPEPTTPHACSTRIPSGPTSTRSPPDASVAVSGMGLVAVDVVTALTIGRGGEFVEDGSALRYRPSGREPRLQLFCRSGLPFTAKSVTGKDRTDVYKPAICTDEALDALSGRSNGRRRLVDVRRELLPLLFGEMYARYYAQVAFQASGAVADGAAVREQLRAAWTEGRFDAELARLGSALWQLRRRRAVLRTPTQLHLQRRLRAVRVSVVCRRSPRGGGAGRREPRQVGGSGVPALPGQDARGGGAGRAVVRLLSRLQCRHLQPDSSPRSRSARAAHAADAGADGRRDRADAIRSRPGSRPGGER